MIIQKLHTYVQYIFADAFSDQVPLNLGEHVWLNAYWYTFLPSGWKWNQFRGHGQALVGRNSTLWEPDPPEGREEDFCGTYGNFEKE